VKDSSLSLARQNSMRPLTPLRHYSHADAPAHFPREEEAKTKSATAIFFRVLFGATRRHALLAHIVWAERPMTS
jgi:hypothetical protein